MEKGQLRMSWLTAIIDLRFSVEKIIAFVLYYIRRGKSFSKSFLNPKLKSNNGHATHATYPRLI